MIENKKKKQCKKSEAQKNSRRRKKLIKNLFFCFFVWFSRCILYEIIAGKSLLEGRERERKEREKGERERREKKEREKGERERRERKELRQNKKINYSFKNSYFLERDWIAAISPTGKITIVFVLLD